MDAHTISGKDYAHMLRVMAGRKIIPGKHIVPDDRLISSYEVSENGRDINVVLHGAVRNVEIKGKITFEGGK